MLLPQLRAHVVGMAPRFIGATRAALRRFRASWMSLYMLFRLETQPFGHEVQRHVLKAWAMTAVRWPGFGLDQPRQ